MIDDGKVCMHCKFLDGSICKAHPPVFTGYREEYGEQVGEFVQPVIDRDWAESCGEWQVADPDKTLEERRREIHRAAVADVSPVEERGASYKVVDEVVEEVVNGLVKAHGDAIEVIRGMDEFLTNRINILSEMAIENLTDPVPFPKSQEEFTKQRRSCYAVSRGELRDLLSKHGVSINRELMK